MQDNFDNLFESINIEEAAKLLDCVGDIKMNEQDRTNMRNNILKKAEKYGIHPEPIENIEKRGKYMDNDNNKSEISDSIVDFNNRDSSSHTKFTKFLKIACVFAVVAGFGTLVTFSIIRNNSNHTSVTPQTATGNPEATNLVATEKSKTSTPVQKSTNNTKKPETSKARTNKNLDINISEISFFYDEPTEDNNCLGINGFYRGEVIWKYISDPIPLADINTRIHIGRNHGTGLIYINAAGITTIDKLTGKEVWRNTSFSSASIASCFDESNTIYICSYHIKDIAAIDKNGKTLWHTDFTETEGLGTNIEFNEGVLTLTVDTGSGNKYYNYNANDGKIIK